MLPPNVDPLKITWRKGTLDDPYVDKSDSDKIINNIFQLTEIPNFADGVQFTGYVEVKPDASNKHYVPSSNEFIVDYTSNTGRVYFNPSENGKTVTSVYKGKGVILYPASRVYMDGNDTTVQGTLKDIIVQIQNDQTDLNARISELDIEMSDVMLTTIYDKNKDGIVDTAANALTLNGKTGDFYTFNNADVLKQIGDTGSGLLSYKNYPVGDMLKLVYDTQNRGFVDKSDYANTAGNAQKLNGQDSSFYATQSGLAELSADVGSLTRLNTTNKGSIVDSINELQAVSHSHSNKADLDKISENSNGLMMYNGTVMGDMLKSSYDSNGNGKVDNAENADRLNGYDSTHFAVASDLTTTNSNIGTLTNLHTTAKDTIVNAVNEVKDVAHTHGNKTVLDGFQDNAGSLYYNDNLIAMSSSSGDMRKAVYDTNNDGIVDRADDSNTLGGHPSTDFALSSNVGDVTTLTTTSKVVVGGINELKTVSHSHGNKTVLDGLTDNAGNLAYQGANVGNGDMKKATYDTNNDGIVDHADNADKLNGQSASFYATQGQVGTLNNLTTTSKADVVSAINENKSNITSNTNKIGDLSTLATNAKDNLVHAINELESSIVSQSGMINDSTTTTTSTWSSSQIVTQINTKSNVQHSNTNGDILIDGSETNVYTHPSGDGNLHVPATGTTNNNKVLKAGSTAGSATWSNVAWSELTGKPTTVSASGLTDAATTTQLGNLTNLTTTNKTDVVSAINEVNGKTNTGNSSIKVGSTTVSGTVEFVAGTGTSLSLDSVSKKVTVASTVDGSLVGTKQVDETAIQDGSYLVYKSSSDKLGYLAPNPISSIKKWTANTAYVVDNVVIYNSAVYHCIVSHTSSSDFAYDMQAASQKWELASGLPSGNSGLAQVTKLGVVASSSSPLVVDIPITNTTDFNRQKTEILKFTAGATNQNVTQCNFNSSDASNFSSDANNEITFDGMLYPKTNYSLPVTNKGAIGSGYYFDAPINSSIYQTVESISVADNVNGYAVSLSGTGQYLTIGSGSLADLPVPWTLEMWVNGSSNGTYSVMLNSSSGSIRYCQYSGSNKLGFTKVGVQDYTFTNAPTPYGGWHHIAYVATTSGTSVYIDGVLKDSLVQYISLPIQTLGGNSSGGNLKGSIDEVRIWNVARTSTDIANSWNKTMYGNESGLLYYWRFEENTGTTANNVISGAPAMTFSGGVTWTNSVPSISDQYKLLIQDGTNIKAYSTTNSSWTVVGTAPVTENMFLTSGMQSLSSVPSSAYTQISSNFDVLAYGSNTLTPSCKVIADPPPKFVTQSNDYSLATYSAINTYTLTANQSGNGVIKILVSTDSGATWKTWNSTSSAWVAVDTSSIGNVNTNGMTVATLNSLTSSNWSSLLGSNPSQIRFGYYLGVSSSTDSASIDTLAANVNYKGSWNAAALNTDYTYGYPLNNDLRVSLYTSGDYKINYQN